MSSADTVRRCRTLVGIGGINLEFHTGENRPLRTLFRLAALIADCVRVGDFSSVIEDCL
jgi:predicted ATPase